MPICSHHRPSIRFKRDTLEVQGWCSNFPPNVSVTYKTSASESPYSHIQRIECVTSLINAGPGTACTCCVGGFLRSSRLTCNLVWWPQKVIYVFITDPLEGNFFAFLFLVFSWWWEEWVTSLWWYHLLLITTDDGLNIFLYLNAFFYIRYSFLVD